MQRRLPTDDDYGDHKFHEDKDREAEQFDFHGSDYDPALDYERLSGQVKRVFHVMSKHQDQHSTDWLTVNDIQQRIMAIYGVDDPATSISAQIRNLRKPGNGSHTIERRRRTETGLFEFKLSPNEDPDRYKKAVRPSKANEIKRLKEKINLIRRGLLQTRQWLNDTNTPYEYRVSRADTVTSQLLGECRISD